MTNNLELNKPVETVTVPKKKKKKKVASLDKKKARAGWFFVLPFLIGFVIIYLPMIVDSIILSFSSIENVRGGGTIQRFVGFANYSAAFFKDANFVTTLGTGITNLLVEVPAILIFSLFMAVLLNQKMAGRAFFRAVFFIPVILSTGLMESIASVNIEENFDDGAGETSATEGIISALDIEILFSYMKIGGGLVEYVTVLINNIYNIVNRCGVQMLIFLAGLQSISPAIYEACSIDGASGWETFWKITFPMISPMILVNGVYTIIDSFTTDSNVVMKYIGDVYQQSEGNVISTAMAWVYFLIVVLMIGAFAGLVSSYIFYQRRDK